MTMTASLEGESDLLFSTPAPPPAPPLLPFELKGGLQHLDMIGPNVVA